MAVVAFHIYNPLPWDEVPDRQRDGNKDYRYARGTMTRLLSQKSTDRHLSFVATYRMQCCIKIVHFSSSSVLSVLPSKFLHCGPA